LKPEVRFKARAQREIREARTWWVDHRDARNAFDEDLDYVIELIRRSPNIGLQVVTRKGTARRVQLERTRHYLYYRVKATGTIEVIALWGGTRRPPRL
jgi:plasmid stabilization system protein ParE